MTRIGGSPPGPMVPWLDEAQKRLEELKGFREDWDSYGGLPITPRSIESVRKYLTHLAADTPRALVIPTSQGGASLEWITDQARISDMAVVPYRQDQAPRLDFWGSDIRNHTTEGDTLWVNYTTSHFRSRSTVS